MNADIWNVIDELRSIVLARRRIPTERLTDMAVPLSELVERTEALSL